MRAVVSKSIGFRQLTKYLVHNLFGWLHCKMKHGYIVGSKGVTAKSIMVTIH